MTRDLAAKALWAFADLLQLMQGGLIALASKAATSGESKTW